MRKRSASILDLHRGLVFVQVILRIDSLAIDFMRDWTFIPGTPRLPTDQQRNDGGEEDAGHRASVADKQWPASSTGCNEGCVWGCPR